MKKYFEEDVPNRGGDVIGIDRTNDKEIIIYSTIRFETDSFQHEMVDQEKNAIDIRIALKNIKEKYRTEG